MDNLTQTRDTQPVDAIEHAFATPIGRFHFPRAHTVNPVLRTAILNAAGSYASLEKSNQGGWRSRDDLFRWPVPEIGELVTWIRYSVDRMIAATAGTKRFEGRLSAGGWASVCRPGDYNAPHFHPQASWSGVYYVDAGDRDETSPQSGCLELLDPRPAAGIVTAPGDPFGDPLRIVLVAGLMVLFPSWLTHWVHPQAGRRERVAISFNVIASKE